MKLWNAEAESQPHAHILFSHNRRKVLTLAFTEKQTTARKLTQFQKTISTFFKNNLKSDSNVLAAENSIATFNPRVATLTAGETKGETCKSIFISNNHAAASALP